MVYFKPGKTSNKEKKERKSLLIMLRPSDKWRAFNQSEPLFDASQNLLVIVFLRGCRRYEMGKHYNKGNE